MADKKRAVKIFLINKDRELLLHLRDNKKGIYYPGYWCLIGGGVDDGESIFEAIKREVKEEIGYELRNIKKIGKTKSLGRNKDIDVIFFKGYINIPAEKIKLSEGQKVEFFKFEEVFKLRIPKFLERFLNENKSEFE